jgi:hypothetical protein
LCCIWEDGHDQKFLLTLCYVWENGILDFSLFLIFLGLHFNF